MRADKKPVIIPIASGKGGSGKSVFAASLAIMLARRGASVVAADLDLGGSNLHTYLGLPNTNPGVGDYLKQQRQRLGDLIIPTDIKGLRFLPGDGKTPFMANISSQQRHLLLTQLQQIRADYLILDLGAGSALNTINLFGLARDGIVITTLDNASMMNALVFLRNFIFANILSLVADQPPIKKMLLDVYRRPANESNLSVEEIHRRIDRHDPRLARESRKRCELYRPRIIYNMADEAEELQVAGRIENTIKKNLSLRGSTMGLLYHDPAVRQAVRKNRVFMQNSPDTPYSRGLAAITKRIQQPAPGAPRLDNLIEEARGHQ